MNLFNIAIVGGLILFALYAGRVVARKSEAKKPVEGGSVANAAHYAAAAIASVLPLTLCSTIFVLQFGRWQSVGICAGLFALEFLLLGIVAISARSSRAKEA
ncbi:MAG: hypothetical protein U0528_15760 [Anaerolineae bacterium]|nr:hypothetical protein [Anaerolineae bacterium]